MPAVMKMSKPVATLRMPNPTAREALVYVLGEGHALHSVIERTIPIRNFITCTCSCGVKFKVENITDVAKALRNVPYEK